MFDHFASSDKTIDDEFIKKRTGFINQLDQSKRQLEIKYTLETTEKKLGENKIVQRS